MRANLARLDSPDWGQIGGWLAGVSGAVLAAYAGFKRDWRGTTALPPGKSDEPHDGDIAIETLRALVKTLQDENQRLWARIKELEQRDDDRDRQGDLRDANMDRYRVEIRKLRARLVQLGVDPGDVT